MADDPTGALTFDLRVGRFYRRELWGARLCIAVAILAFAFAITWCFFAFSVLVTPDTNQGTAVVLLSGLFAVPVAVLLGLVLLRWGYYTIVRGPAQLTLMAEGILLVDASGRSLRVPYTDPSMDTLPWYVPPHAGPKAWMTVPGAGSMIWFPPAATERIRERIRVRDSEDLPAH